MAITVSIRLGGACAPFFSTNFSHCSQVAPQCSLRNCSFCKLLSLRNLVGASEFEPEAHFYFSVFSVIWGICLSLKANPNGMKRSDSRTLLAQGRACLVLTAPGNRRFQK